MECKARIRGKTGRLAPDSSRSNPPKQAAPCGFCSEGIACFFVKRVLRKRQARKKGAEAPFFHCIAASAFSLADAPASVTRFDLHQRFSWLWRQWLAFTWHMHRRHDLGCGSLSGAQFFRIG